MSMGKPEMLSLIRGKLIILTSLSEYKIWHNILYRCKSDKCPQYSYYGGRGINVCDRWSNFYCFIEDMGPRPSLKHEIDRIDNNGPYSKENCRWATISLNGFNRRGRTRKHALPRGVYLKENGRFEAKIKIEGISCHLGTFKVETEAKNAYESICLEWYGANSSENRLGVET